MQRIGNAEIAKLFRDVAAAYSIKNENKYRFQIIAYTKASDIIGDMNTEIKDLLSESDRIKIPGIGEAMLAHIQEILETGHVAHFETVMKDIPPSVFVLLDVPSFGPKKAFKIVDALGLENKNTIIEDVEKAATEGRIAPLPGFGKKSEEDIIQALQEYKVGKTKSRRMILPYAFDISEKVLAYIKKSPYVRQAFPLGSLRRMMPTIGDVDIAVDSDHPDEVLEHFIKYPGVERVISKGDAKSSILVSGGRQVDLMVQPPIAFGSLLQHFTGSKHHNVALREYALRKGMSLSEYGIKVREKGKEVQKKFEHEDEFYKFIGLELIPPEIRENEGEIELAAKNALPRLVELKNMNGDLHIHSSYPIESSHDLGQNTMEEMLEKAIKLKYEYLGFSEHNPSVGNHTKEQIYRTLEERQDKIETLREKYKGKIKIINLMETDILASGELALDDQALSYLDATIVSIHSSFSTPKEEMTKRVLNGLLHPKAKIFAHPSGRLLNDRPGYELDWEKLFDFVVKHDKALEINAWPTRLDLADTLVKQAKDFGAKFIIDTDSHALHHMDNMFYGVAVARRGWCEAHDILNTYSYAKFKDWLKTS